MDMIQDKRKGALKKGGMGILLLTGFIFIGIAYSVVTSSALSGLLLLAFGLLLIFSVLEFLSNEMMVTFGNAVQENRGSQWTARIGQFVDQNIA